MVKKQVKKKQRKTVDCTSVSPQDRTNAAQSEIAAICARYNVSLVPMLQLLGSEISGNVFIRAN